MREPTVDEIVVWFNAWLRKPIDHRDKVIIESMLGHVRNHPADIFKAVEDRKRWDAMGLKEKLSSEPDEKLWLWRDGDHFVAYRHLYPCYPDGGDPLTLGEPVGYALLKPSSAPASGPHKDDHP